MEIADLRSRRFVIFDLFHTLSTIWHASVQGPDTSELLGVDRETYLRAVFDNSVRRLTGEIDDPVEVVRDIAEASGSTVPSSEFERIARIREHRFAESLRRVAPSTLSALDSLRANGKTLALISNADVIEAAGWDESPLSDRFGVAVFSCFVGMAKPDLEIFQYCLDALGTAAENAVFVGDGGSNEFTGARALGIPTVCTVEFIRDTWPDKVEKRKSQADLSVESLEELAAALTST